MNVSIIIVNYNTTKLLQQCIDSIVKRTKGVSYEIIVVDNHSREEEVVPLRQDGRIILLEQQENLGFGRANNIGAAHSKGEHLFLLNPDTILVNDAITILYEHLKSNPHTGLCGGNIFDSDMRPIHSHDRMPPNLLCELDIITRHIYSKLAYGKNSWFNHTQKQMKVALITGADMMVRRQAWDEVGGFDMSFFMYFEDSDLCVCIKDKGYDIMNVPDAHIIHLEGKSFHESRARVERYFAGRNVFFRKHYSLLYNKITDGINICSFRAGVTLFRLLGKEQQADIYQQRLEVYKDICRQNKQ